MKKINIGVIGGGYISQICYLPYLYKNKFCNLITIAESRPSLNKYLKSKYKNVKVIDDYNELIKDPSIDSIVICVPRKSNSKISYQCLMNKKNVFCEKPMAYSIVDAKNISIISKKNNLVYATAYMKRFDHSVIFARKFIFNLIKSNSKGSLIKVNFINNSFKMNMKTPPHKKPLERRKLRLPEGKTSNIFLTKKNKISYDWFMNVLSHDINLINFFFDLKKIKIMHSMISSKSVDCNFNFLKTSINLSASKSNYGFWGQSIEFIFENARVLINLKEPFDRIKLANITYYDNLQVNKPKNLSKYGSWCFESQINNFINVLYNKKSYIENNGGQILLELEFIEKLYKSNVFSK